MMAGNGGGAKPGHGKGTPNSQPYTDPRSLIEQAIARNGTPEGAAIELKMPPVKVQLVFDQMLMPTKSHHRTI